MFERLKPSHREIRALALRETDPSEVDRFRPISHGPVFAVLALAAVGLAALPSMLVRLFRSHRSNQKT